jgi:hypothetical protein
MRLIIERYAYLVDLPHPINKPGLKTNAKYRNMIINIKLNISNI